MVGFAINVNVHLWLLKTPEVFYNILNMPNCRGIIVEVISYLDYI